jgi:hypothetical protein
VPGARAKINAIAPRRNSGESMDEQGCLMMRTNRKLITLFR